MRKLWLVLGFGVLLVGCGSDTGAPSNPSTAYMLASLDNGSNVSQGDASIATMQSALDSLSSKCTENETKLGDESDVIHTELQAKGIDETHLSILQQVRASIPSGMARTRCADIFAAYAVLRENG